MKKIISIVTIAALAGILAIGCSTPEDTGKTGGEGATPTTNPATDVKTDSGKMEDKTADAGKMEDKSGDAVKTEDAGKSGDAVMPEEKKEEGK